MTDNNQLPGHVSELLNAIHGYLSMFDVLQQRGAYLPKSNTIEPGKMRRHARQVRPIAEPIIVNWYEPLIEHADAILTLTNDNNLRVLIRKLKRVAAAEVDNLRELLTQTEKTSGPDDALRVLLSGYTMGAFGMFARRQQIKSAMSELKSWQDDHAA